MNYTEFCNAIAIFLLHFHALLHVVLITSIAKLSNSAGTSIRLHLACIWSG